MFINLSIHQELIGCWMENDQILKALKFQL